MTAAPRLLRDGDEAVAEAACRQFGRLSDDGPASFLIRPETTLFVIEANDDVVGWVYGQELAHPGGQKTMLLYALDVAESHRRQGLATSLVRAFLEDAEARGCGKVWLLTEHDNEAAQATYASVGGMSDGERQVMFTWVLTRQGDA